MAIIAPVLDLNMEILRGLEAGKSMRSALVSYVSKTDVSADIYEDVISLIKYSETKIYKDPKYLAQTHSRRWLYELVVRSLMNGEPVYIQLEELQEALFRESLLEIEEDSDRLPFVCLIPLFFLMVPSFLLILLFPLLKEFSNV